MTLATPMLTFDASTHQYFLGGVIIPGLSQVLIAQGLRQSRGDEAAMARGSDVHRLTALDDMDALYESEIPDTYRGYVTAWCTAKRDLDLTTRSFEHIEEPIASVQHRYGCTPDRVVMVRGDYHAVVELKTGSPDPADGIQLAAQAIAARDTYGLTVIPRRMAVYIERQGQYKVVEYTEPTDGHTFLCALANFSWRVKHSKLNGNGG